MYLENTFPFYPPGEDEPIQLSYEASYSPARLRQSWADSSPEESELTILAPLDLPPSLLSLAKQACWDDFHSIADDTYSEP